MLQSQNHYIYKTMTSLSFETKKNKYIRNTISKDNRDKILKHIQERKWVHIRFSLFPQNSLKIEISRDSDVSAIFEIARLRI